PRDQQYNGIGRSYSMNFFASGGVNTYVPVKPSFASFWGSNSKPSAQLLLIGEKFSHNASALGYATNATIGTSGADLAAAPGPINNFPGRRFIGNLNINFAPTFGVCPTEF